MTAKLVIEEGDLKGLSLPLEEGDTWTVGRDPDECQLVIEDPLVSRIHLTARRTPEGIVIENLSDTHPTLLNDEEVAGPTLLKDNDLLHIGGQLLRFYEETLAQVHEPAMDDLEEWAPPEEPGEKDTNESESNSEDPADPSPSKQEPVPKPPASAPNSEPAPALPADNQGQAQETVFNEEPDYSQALAEIDFGIVDTGRWLLKVIGGPNSGAEFYMHAGNSYLIGTDPQSCDIVFHDTSVSRQHARITVTDEEELLIEDLKSRNGILINGALVKDKQPLTPSTIVTLGTTSFVVYDREGEMQTIISPLLPSIVKVLQQEPEKEETPSGEGKPPNPEDEGQGNESPPAQEQETPPPAKSPSNASTYIIFAAVAALFVLVGIGTTTLFHDEPVVMQTQENANELISEVLKPFPAVYWTFNKNNGSLLLLGHILTAAEKSRLFYHLGDLKFIKSFDDSGIIIDEGVLNEVNSLLLNNPEWKGIRVYSPEAGQFILSGMLKTRKQADQLSSYLSLNFPYLDSLKKQVMVEEDAIQEIKVWLQNATLADVTVTMSNGEVILGGSYPEGLSNALNEILGKVKQMPGVRVVSNQTRIQTAETGTIDLTGHYTISGKSRLNKKYTVVINGRILSEGDDLDGMLIDKITPSHIYLHKDQDKFKIDY